MAEIETLGILQDIESLVADKLQVASPYVVNILGEAYHQVLLPRTCWANVDRGALHQFHKIIVSYKWLSRSYLISSDTAKRLLQEFVEKHESGLQVVYALSGWLKNSSPSYHIRLVAGPKLPEAKQDFDGTCSIQVYSVQTSIPKDPAALWNAEFVQAEELFKQPFTADNCLRDNRFCGISNSHVKRSIDEMPASVAAPQARSAVDTESTKKDATCQNITVPQPQKCEMKKVSPDVGLQNSTVVKEVKGDGTESFHQASKPIAVKEKVASLPANKKKAQSDKTSSSTGGSLANLWGRVPTKSILSDNHADVNRPTANPTVSSAEAQICALEAVQCDSSDDDDQNVNIKRTSNESGRKRRIVIDFSDDEDFEEAVSLASPENPKDQSCLDLKQNTALHKEKAHLNNDKQLNGKLKIMEEKTTESRQSSVQEKQHNSSLAEKNENFALENNSSKREKPTDAAPASPKRRKVLRTRIDERGREVNEVVWEGDKQEQKNDDVSLTKKSDHKDAETTTSSPPPVKKSPALGTSGANPAGKAGAKKAGNATGPKQGNILSFFKRV